MDESSSSSSFHPYSASSDPDDEEILSLETSDLEEVLLDPRIFHRAVKQLHFKPSADMFASRTHHQLPRYFSRHPDPQAVATDAFRQNWQAEHQPYINPPWSLINQVIQKLCREGVRAMLVIPEWPNAKWYPKLCRITEKMILLTEPCYLDQAGELRPPPRWRTRIAVVNGSRA